MTGLPMAASAGGVSPFSVMLMLRGAVLSDVRRIISGPAAGAAMCSGSVGGDLKGVVGLVGVDEGGSRVAAPGVVEGGAARVDACEGVRDTMVGTGVGLGAGRV
jgi:hypothetical protein